MGKKFGKLNLLGIPNVSINDGCNRFELAHQQETFVTQQLKDKYPFINWGLTADMLGSSNNEQNRINGDIIGIWDNKIYCCIDLKVQSIGSKIEYGGIDLNSFVGFCYQSTNRYYIMAKSDGSDFLVVSNNDIVSMFRRKIKCIEKTLKAKRTPFYNVNVDWMKEYYIRECDFVAQHDYIRGDIIKRYQL